MCAVQLEEIEPSALAGLGRANELLEDLRHLIGGELVRDLVGGCISNR